ncbi:MAG: ATP-dependent DNA helicase RecG [Candidatus Blackburnbacteria bacterium RIFCSPHIGHO2_12_FULL_41_13b]|uniref:ATP-dependent DNA helicase RecG n=1 Tax=Candidatus Blackburnbacteria bacterium RIFCSPHIGHO2_12_FULL_41_13b TaxID=1797517 RepID=A0A1G1V488_9BACT|nr:MAG: ATP-dependent DNA helicase RecG [Candidatus Blackburnbacteria bacterium RIFCSPHIGHO2_12_FULL_41_13b]
MLLSDHVSKIPLVGESYAKRLEKLGIETIQDLLEHFPHRYQNFSLVSTILTAQPGEVVTIQGQVVQIKNVYTRSGKTLQLAVISDGTDTLDVTWFNQSYLVKSLSPGTWLSLSGKISAIGRKRSLVSPQFEKISNFKFQISNSETLHTGRLVPIYPETYGLSSKWLRAKIARLLSLLAKEIEEYLPLSLLEEHNLLERRKAVEQAHFPESAKEAKDARRRLAFDEFFSLQLNSLWRKLSWKNAIPAPQLKIDQKKVTAFIKSLPFTLTQGQKQATDEILQDMRKPQSMNRLLEGDVGSGKTVVAALAAYVAWTNGYKSIFMAPTQILANQHFNTLKNILEPFGAEVGLVTSGQNLKFKISNLKFDVVVGTHALLHQVHLLENVALAVIDEQHRFGVAQRALLAQKRGEFAPHVLTMTATPIPRTIALTMYSDLDLSVINELPKGRLKIKTWVVGQQKRVSAYKWIRERVKNTSEQAFIVCPLIDVSEAETLKNVKAASVEFIRLQKEVFPDLRLGMLHGRIKQKEKDIVMNKFKRGELDILVSTPVVEVGIDIPNATIMLIEASERFGLAQLHQLRGRVGRAQMQSYCLLFTENRSQKVYTRLKALEQGLSGPQLADLDLKLRGPGEVYGTAQSGFPELKVGSYSDLELIKLAREVAEKIIDQIDKHPKIKKLIEEKTEISSN